jgi:hypothetical protein
LLAAGTAWRGSGDHRPARDLLELPDAGDALLEDREAPEADRAARVDPRDVGDEPDFGDAFAGRDGSALPGGLDLIFDGDGDVFVVLRRLDAGVAHMREALVWRPKPSIRSGRLAGCPLRSSAAWPGTWRDAAASTLLRTPRFCCCLAVQSCTARFASVIRRAPFSGRPL